MQHTKGKRGPSDRKGMSAFSPTDANSPGEKQRGFCRPCHPKTTLTEFKKKKKRLKISRKEFCPLKTIQLVLNENNGQEILSTLCTMHIAK